MYFPTANNAGLFVVVVIIIMVVGVVIVVMIVATQRTKTATTANICSEINQTDQNAINRAFLVIIYQ
jgi:hypothetical protein